MRTRRTSFLLATTSAAALSVFAFGAATTSPALAQFCAVQNGTGGTDNTAGGGYTGNANDNVVTCGDAGTAGGDVLAAGGNDTITTTGSNLGDIQGDDGDDTIILNNDGGNAGSIFEVFGGDGKDVITLNGASVSDDINGGNNDDVILLNAGEVVDAFGDDGDDTIVLNGARVFGDVDGDEGDDLIRLLSGSVGDTGQDEVLGGIGDDTIILNGVDLTGDLEGNDGNDTIMLFSGEVGSEVFGGAGRDIITLSGAVVAIDIFGDGGDDVISLNSGEVIDVFGGDDDDTIVMNGAVVTGDIDGEDGDDLIRLLSGNVGDSGFDDVIGGLGKDTIILDGAFVLRDIEGGDDDDTILLLSGEVGDEVFGGLGDDTITLDGAEVGTDMNADGDDINGDEGDDVILLLDGVVERNVNGGDDNDTITLNGATTGGDIDGGDGDDIILLLSGVTGNSNQDDIIGGLGQDTIRLDGAFVETDIEGNEGNDLIFLTAGTVDDDVLGGADDDRISVNGALVGDVVLGDDGDDTIALRAGTIGSFAAGGSNDDIGRVSGTFDFDNLGGGAGNFAGDDNTATDQGFDVLAFDGWTGGVNADRLPEWNVVGIDNGSRVTFTGGTLQTNGPANIAVAIDPLSTMLLSDTLTIAGDLFSFGRVDLRSGDTDPDNVLTINGALSAIDAVMDFDTFLDDGKGADTTDLLIVGSDTSGTTNVFVTNAGGPGGLTGDGPTDGILLVDVGGVSDGDFVLSNDLVGGTFGYDLVKADGQNWYLQSDFLDQIYVYEALPTAMQTIGSALIGQLVERVGVRSGVASTLTDADGNPVLGGQPVDTALWARAVGASVESEGDLDSTTGGNFEQTLGFIQAGGEVVVTQGTSGRLLIGALGHWGTSSVDVFDSDNDERGGADFDFYGGGLTATWYGTSGLYVDGVVQYTAYDIDISTATRWSSQETDGYGIAASGEVGYRIPISSTAALVPQAQVVWQTIDFDDFTDPDGVTVSLNDGDSLVGRLGVAFENSAAIGSSLVTGYVEANVLHEFLGDNEINTFTGVGGTIPISQDVGGTSVEVGFGGTIAVNSGVSLYGEIDYTIPFDNGVQGFQALAGVRVNLNPVAPPPPAPVIAPVAETAFIVFFDWDRANLTPEANLVLDDVVVTANEAGYASIRLDGYTDLSGSAAYNLGLSERRANSVADGLIARGIAPDEIVIRAFGEENPLVPTPDGVREPQNRRVEIFLS